MSFAIAMQPPDGLQRMVMLSLAVHIVFLVAVLLIAAERFGRRRVDAAAERS